MKHETFTNSLGMTFVQVTPCTFMMESPVDKRGRYGDETHHQVTLTKGSYIQTTPVTQKQWMQVMEDNPSSFKDGGEDRPVENIAWQDCQAFIRRLNEKEGTDRFRLP